MLRNLRWTVCGWTLVAAWLSAGTLWAQEEVLSQFYGSGVHNYYERDYFAAMRELSAAIDGGTNDPRAYYYRGLTHTRLGDTAAAGRDMQKGAELESADVNQFYPVGRSLERVQGYQRIALERYRSMARAQVRERQLKNNAARYEQRRGAEAQVLRSVPLGPPPAPLRRPEVSPAAAVEPAAPLAAAAGPAEKPQAEKPADKSLFDDKPAEKAPAAEKPAADPDADNPFGDQDEKMPADKGAGEPSGEEKPPGNS